jgi:hypothetical protein
MLCWYIWIFIKSLFKIYKLSIYSLRLEHYQIDYSIHFFIKFLTVLPCHAQLEDSMYII